MFMLFQTTLGLLVALGLGGSITALAQTAPASSLAATIKASKWQKRVLLLCAGSPDDTSLLRQQQLLAPAKAELDSRDLLVREVIPSQLSGSDQRYLRQQLNVTGTGFMVLLIGKDGGVKRRETQPLAPAQVFATIDAMPMRQQEMKRPK
ncbi:hypothetical protein GCM10027346_25320 [Hymenobacter seoulensis]